MKAIDKIIRDMEVNSDMWELGKYVFWRKNNNSDDNEYRGDFLKVWIGNGLFFYGLYECREEAKKFTFIEKIKFQIAYNKWLRKSPKIRKALKEEKEICKRKQVDKYIPDFTNKDELEKMWRK